jgi:hypothetical protein
VIKAKELKSWFRTLGYPQVARPPRRNPDGLVAKRGNDSLGQIKIIGRNGFFLQTTERWPIGEVFSLSVQKEDAKASDSELIIDVPVRVASHREDGVGMAFVLPEGMDIDLWEHIVDTADTPIESQDTQFIFRMVRAILFLYRLCPSRAMQPILVLTGEMDQFRTGSMLTITLTAEKMLAEEPDAKAMHANPEIVAGIMKSGSWQFDDLTQRLWAGLLASSCSKDGTDQSNQDLVDVLGEVTVNQAHILVEGCRRASDQPTGDGGVARSFIVTSEEMIGITGMYDFFRNATDVAYLHGYGLIENNFDFSTHSTKTTFDITPSPLGMRLFKACRGHLLESVKVHSYSSSGNGNLAQQGV